MVPGVARIASHIVEPGVIKQTGNFAKLEFAESDGKPSARTAAFHKACKDAGIDATLSANIGRELWMKFAMLAPHAGHDGADARADRAGAKPIRNRLRC